MGNIRKLSLALATWAALLGLAITGVDTRPSCVRVAAWAFEHDLSDYSLHELRSLPVQYRRIAVAYLEPSRRSAVWQEHYGEILVEADLTPEERALVEEAYAFSTPEGLSRGFWNTPDDPYEFDGRAAVAFNAESSPDAWVRYKGVFTDLHGETTPTIAGLSLHARARFDRLAEWLSPSVHAHCNCQLSFRDCGISGTCDHSGCGTYRFGCGSSGRTLCTGECKCPLGRIWPFWTDCTGR